MTIEFTEKSYILGMWFADMPNGDDSLITWWRELPDGQWKGVARYRRRNSDKIFDHDDEKTWYDMKTLPDETEDNLIKKMDDMQRAMGFITTFQDKLIVKGNVRKFLKMSKGKKWIQMKTEKRGTVQ